MTDEWFVCKGGPFDKQLFRAGDDVPEGWRITLSIPTGRTIFVGNRGKPSFNGDEPVPEICKGTYTRKGDVLVWSEGIK